MATSTEPTQKPIHSIIIDTGPLIQNAVSISTIIASAELLYTTPAIISEIRDAATRSRVETTLKPFLNIRSPAPASFDAVSSFAKKTGDFNLLSRQDLGILALAYEVHCEKHGGPWGLRDAPNAPLIKSSDETGKEKEGGEPGQKKKRSKRRGKKTASGPAVEAESEEPTVSDDGWTQIGTKAGGGKPKRTAPPPKFHLANQASNSAEQEGDVQEKLMEQEVDAQEMIVDPDAAAQENPVEQQNVNEEGPGIQREDHIEPEKLADPEHFVEQPTPIIPETDSRGQEQDLTQPVEANRPDQAPSDEQQPSTQPNVNEAEPAPAARPFEEDFSALQLSETTQQPTPPTSDDDSDGGDWITPENLSTRQAEDNNTQPLTTQQTQTSVATMTTDFAMQNVLLQMNLNLLSTNMQRIRKLRTSVLRCHACFLVTKEMDKQFCPRCGGPSLTRVSCSTNANGEFKIHLSKNFQHNTRGNRYSIPKPVAGTSNGKLAGKGGGKGGWGRELVLAEDQKEFTKQIVEGKRMQTRDLMDEDYLPGILTGDRGRAGGRPKVGAGRNINSRKRF